MTSEKIAANSPKTLSLKNCSLKAVDPAEKLRLLSKRVTSECSPQDLGDSTRHKISNLKTESQNVVQGEIHVFK